MSPTEVKAPEPPLRRSRGRPRDTGLQQKIKDAALTVLARHGFSGLTLERVCAEAQVPKATFYRRWDNPTACVIEAFLEAWSEVEFVDTGAPAEDLGVFAHKLIKLYSHPKLGPCSVAMQLESRLSAQVGASQDASARRRRAKNASALQQALNLMPTPPALSAELILNVLNGVARNVYSLNWPVSDEELRKLVQSLLAPASAS